MMQTQAISILKQCEDSMRFSVKDNPPALFHLESGGSRTRALFCIETGIALQLPAQSITALACTIELLHNASLIHDDLQDSETVRRGRPAVWKKYNKSHAICAGDVMISAAYSMLANIGTHPSLAVLLQHTHQAINTTIKGQSQDLDATDSITEQHYEHIAAMKSGPLLQLTLTLPLLMSHMTQHVTTSQHALQQFAVAYQIIDDLDDWQQDLQQNNLNLINILAKQCDTDEAIYKAQSRAQYLLAQCEQALIGLPDHCAASIVMAAQKLSAKTRAGVYE